MLLLEYSYLRIHNIFSYLRENKLEGCFNITLISFIVIMLNITIFSISLIIIYITRVSDELYFNLFLTFCLYTGFVLFYICFHIGIDTEHIDDDCISVASSVTISSEQFVEEIV